MRILVVGSSGNMGKRYCSIVKYLKHDLLTFDISTKDVLPTDYDAVILATPVSEHAIGIKQFKDRPILCEKPITYNMPDLCKLISVAGVSDGNIFMVNNWAFVGQERDALSERRIVVRTYNTGNDGFHDLIQPLMLVENIDDFCCVKDYPGLYVEISGKIYGRDDFDQSYIDMIQAFADGRYDRLWHIEDTIIGHERVKEYAGGWLG